MVWLWVSAVIVLLGGQLNAEMEHHELAPVSTGQLGITWRA